MIKHRDWTIEFGDYWYWQGYEAVHDNYDAEHDAAGTWTDNGFPVFQGNTVQDCIEQIDDWYGEQNGN